MNKHLKLHNRIYDIRTQQNLTQTELAEMVGISQNALSSIENHVNGLSAYYSGLICKALNVKWEDLFFYE